MAFIKKSLKTTETVGSYLSALMEEQGVGSALLARHLQVQEKQIEALLADRPELLPGAFYVRHLSRLIANLLGGDCGYIDRLFLRVHGTLVVEETSVKTFLRAKVQPKSLFVVARFFTGSLFVGGFLVLLVYFGFSARHAFLPPTLQIVSPSADVVTKERTVTIEGKTEPEVNVKVNSQIVLLDDMGAFRTPLYLDEGLNVIEIRAGKPYSKEHVAYRRIFVEAKNATITSNDRP